MKPFEQVVAEQGPTILRVCRAMLDPCDADDAWSETFLSALRAYPELAEGTSVQAWLVTIAQRKVIDVHRARARRPLLLETVPDASPTEEKPIHDELWSALRALPRKQREAIAYHHLGGLPYAEVAELLDNSESAARRAAADGMKSLRATYQGALP